MRKTALALAVLLILSAMPSMAAAEGNSHKVALVMKALTNPFFSKMKQGAEEYSREHGIPLEVFGTERETDVSHQIAIVESLIARRYGAVVIAPADSRKLIPVCAKAVEAGIVVVNIDNPLHAPTLKRQGLIIPFVGSDNRQGASLVGDYIRRRLGGNGRVAVIEGIRGVENAELRRSGFVETVTQGGGVEVVASESANWHQDEALSVVTEVLERHTELDAIFCANDSMALGALQALDMLDIGHRVLVAGYDNIRAVRSEMERGRIAATVEQHPELMGRYGVALAVEALGGRQVAAYTSTPLDLITGETFGRMVGLSVSDLSNPFFETLYRNARNQAELAGMQLEFRDADNDDAEQLVHFDELIKSGVELIIVNPTNAQTVGAGVELANAADIPVITVDRTVSTGSVICHIASDNREGGRMAARFIRERLPDGAEIIELEGIPGTSAAFERSKGFGEVVAEEEGLSIAAREVGNFDKEQGRRIMASLLESGVTFNAVFAHNDNMLLGAAEALEGAGFFGDAVLVGFDGIPAALRAVREGRIHATVVQSADLMGRAAMQRAMEFFREGEVGSAVQTVPLKIVTR